MTKPIIGMIAGMSLFVVGIVETSKGWKRDYEIEKLNCEAWKNRYIKLSDAVERHLLVVHGVTVTNRVEDKAQ